MKLYVCTGTNERGEGPCYRICTEDELYPTGACQYCCGLTGEWNPDERLSTLARNALALATRCYPVGTDPAEWHDGRDALGWEPYGRAWCSVSYTDGHWAAGDMLPVGVTHLRPMPPPPDVWRDPDQAMTVEEQP